MFPRMRNYRSSLSSKSHFELVPLELRPHPHIPSSLFILFLPPTLYTLGIHLFITSPISTFCSTDFESFPYPTSEVISAMSPSELDISFVLRKRR